MGNFEFGIELIHVKQSFALKSETLEVLRDINLNIAPGEFVSIVGESGCGKSTLLRLIAGLDRPKDGTVRVNGRDVLEPSIETGVLFQESRLLPWYSTEKNIAYGLPESFPKSERRDRVEELIDLVGLRGFEKALPEQLSGGMQKRVALARTLASRPKVLLLDEPFGALDAFTKMRLQEELHKIWESERPTTLLVTHDIDEAIYLGQKVVMMSPKPGVIKQTLSVAFEGERSRTSEEFDRFRKIVYSQFDLNS